MIKMKIGGVIMKYDYLINNEIGYKLYSEVASQLPIIDFHSHLKLNKLFDDSDSNIAKMWLYGDHYKWRLMRLNGVSEKYITGDSCDYDKFSAWIETLEWSYGNPVYDWSTLELSKYFDYSLTINSTETEKLWKEFNSKINNAEVSPVKILEKDNVEYFFTNDSPLSCLDAHDKINRSNLVKTRVIPTLRLDDCINVESKNFLSFIDDLFGKYDYEELSLNNYLSLIENKFIYFIKHGCKAVDIGLKELIFVQPDYERSSYTFKRLVTGDYSITEFEYNALKSYLLFEFLKKCKEYHLVCQLHLGVRKDVNSISFNKIGENSGFDAVYIQPDLINELSSFFDSCNTLFGLPKIIVYCLDSKHYDSLAILCSAFGNVIPGQKSPVQLGAPWWFNDNYKEILAHFEVVESHGLLNNYIGMLTDSRSYLSFSRHDYFRRVLCNYIGEQVQMGKYPEDFEKLKVMVTNICYTNSKTFFDLE